MSVGVPGDDGCSTPSCDPARRVASRSSSDDLAACSSASRLDLRNHVEKPPGAPAPPPLTEKVFRLAEARDVHGVPLPRREDLTWLIKMFCRATEQCGLRAIRPAVLRSGRTETIRPLHQRSPQFRAAKPQFLRIIHELDI